MKLEICSYSQIPEKKKILVIVVGHQILAIDRPKNFSEIMEVCEIIRELSVGSLFQSHRAWIRLLVGAFYMFLQLYLKISIFFSFVNNLVTKVVFNENNKCL